MPAHACASGSPSFPSSLATLQAKSADSFVDSVGLNVHFSFSGPYLTYESQMLRALQSLGVRHLRDQMAWQGTSSGSPFYTVHKTLASYGIKTDYILTSIDYPMSQVTAYPSLVNDMEAIEPTNEYDASGASNWANAIRSQQETLANTVHGSSAFARVILLAPSMAQPLNASQIGDISGHADAGNLHAYFGGWNPGNSGTNGANNAGYFLKLSALYMPHKPAWVTETGYWSARVPYYGGAGVGESVMATYTPRELFAFWLAGVPRTYVYELIDSNTTDLFGLFSSNGTAKPAYYALKGLLNLLSDPGSTFAPGKLTYCVTGADTQVKQILFQKRDGSFYIALWVEAPSLNATNEADIIVPTQTLQVILGKAVQSATQYSWQTSGQVSTSSLMPGASFPVAVGPQLTILQLVPTHATTPPSRRRR